MATENPYPTGADVPYRLANLEKWRDSMEQTRIPTELALQQARLNATEMLVAKHDVLLEALVKRDNERTGWLQGNKAVITVVGFFLLNFISVAVLLSDKFG